MKINNLLIVGALKPEACCPSQSLQALRMDTRIGALLVCASLAEEASPLLLLCSFTGGALVKVYLCLLVILDFFIDPETCFLRAARQIL